MGAGSGGAGGCARAGEAPETTEGSKGSSFSTPWAFFCVSAVARVRDGSRLYSFTLVRAQTERGDSRESASRARCFIQNWKIEEETFERYTLKYCIPDTPRPRTAYTYFTFRSRFLVLLLVHINRAASLVIKLSCDRPGFVTQVTLQTAVRYLRSGHLLLPS